MSGDSSAEKRFAVVAETRRRWSRSEKQAIVEECAAGKTSVSAIARKHNIAPNLLFRWRSEFGAGSRRRGAATPSFLPVALPALNPAEGTAPAASRPEERGRIIEIELAGGYRLRVDASVDGVALRRVIEVLEGR